MSQPTPPRRPREGALEADFRRYLGECCAVHGWECLVLVDTVNRKHPDRTILGLEGGQVAFAEVKKPDAPMNTPHVKQQRDRLAELSEKGFPVGFLRTADEIEAFVLTLRNGYGWRSLLDG